MPNLTAETILSFSANTKLIQCEEVFIQKMGIAKV